LKILSEIRNEDGSLPEFAWPGGYPIYYLDEDNCCLCPKCANQCEDAQPVAYGIHWEGDPIQCEECNAMIESAYGEPSIFCVEEETNESTSNL
jgi:predicted molibdopterin-dependent oxidoreductase YjgC